MQSKIYILKWKMIKTEIVFLKEETQRKLVDLLVDLSNYWLVSS